MKDSKRGGARRGRIAQLGFILLFCGLFAASSGFCQPPIITEFILPNANTTPQSMFYGADNFYWLTGFQTDQIIRIDPSTNGVKVYNLPTTPAHPFGIVTIGTNVWFTENYANNIGLLYTNVAINGIFHTTVEYPIHPSNNSVPCGPAGLAIGPDGNLWFVESQVGKIGVFSPVLRGLLHEYTVPYTPGTSQFYNITRGPDGNMWYTDSGGCRICAINTNGAAAVFPLATGTQPFDITVGPDRALWFTEFNAGKIGRLTTNCFTNASFTTTGKLSTNIVKKGVLTEIYVPTDLTAVQPYGITVAPAGAISNVWFCDFAGNTIDRVNVLGADVTDPGNYTITQFPTPTSGTQPTRLASGADLNLWFGEWQNNSVGILVLDHYLKFNVTNLVSGSTSFKGTLGFFYDVPYDAFATNYAASIKWGDGTTSIVHSYTTANKPVQIVANPSGGFKFTMTTNHVFPSNGTFNVTITVTNQGSVSSSGGAVGSASFSITVAVVPTLTIRPAGDNDIVLSWITLATNFVLQENTNLAGTNWVNVTNQPIKGPGDLYTVTNAASGDVFYRLKQE